MALILHIETATTVCSVALSENGKQLALKEETEGYRHAENITLFIEEVLKHADRNLHELDAISVSSGPGSYTGLRIGASTAKGLCYALDRPLISIATLKSMANSIYRLPRITFPALLCPMIDARRMEVYCALYNDRLQEVEKVSAKIMDENSFSLLLREGTMYFFGDGAEKCKVLFKGQTNAIFLDKVRPSATSMISLAEEKFNQMEFENVSLFDPMYLKSFDAKK